MISDVLIWSLVFLSALILVVSLIILISWFKSYLFLILGNRVVLISGSVLCLKKSVYLSLCLKGRIVSVNPLSWGVKSGIWYLISKSVLCPEKSCLWAYVLRVVSFLLILCLKELNLVSGYLSIIQLLTKLTGVKKSDV